MKQIYAGFLHNDLPSQETFHLTDAKCRYIVNSNYKYKKQLRKFAGMEFIVSVLGLS